MNPSPEQARLQNELDARINQALHLAVDLQKYHVDSGLSWRESEVGRYARITEALTQILDDL